MKRHMSLPEKESRRFEVVPFVDLQIVVGKDEIPNPQDLQGSVVRTKVVVPPEQRAQWEEDGGIEKLRKVLEQAGYAYPIDVEIRKDVVAAERRVIKDTQPEKALREYVSAMGIPEGDAALVIDEGVAILQECGLI